MGAGADATPVQEADNDGLGDIVVLGDLGRRQSFFKVEGSDFIEIEEFRKKRDPNEINDIRGVRTDFGLLDHFLVAI